MEKENKIKKVPFNHFILWCKGWYQFPELEYEENRFKELQRVFELDGYLPNNDAYHLAVFAYEDIMKFLDKHIKFSDIIFSLSQSMFGYNGKIVKDADDWGERVLSVIRDKVRFEELKGHELYIAPEGLRGMKYTQGCLDVEVFFKDKVDNDIKLYGND